MTLNNISFAAGVCEYADHLSEHIGEVKKGDSEFNAGNFRVSITLKSNYQHELPKRSCYLTISSTKFILFPNSNFLFEISFHLTKLVSTL